MNQTDITSKQRMQWLDAMRGFTMIMVVANHVLQFSFQLPAKMSASMPLLTLFRMPLFFFISGFLAYKMNFLWTGKSFASITWKKIRIQVLPTLVFLCAYIVIREPGSFWDNFMHAMESPTKSGYWFTWTLLLMFIIYYIFAYIEQKLKCESWMPITILWMLSLFAYETLYLPDRFTYHKDLFFDYSSMLQVILFFHFFLTGNIVHRYWNQFQRIMDSQWFMPLVIIMTFLCCGDIFKWHTLKFEWTNLPRTTAMYLLLIIVVMFFRYYEAWFTQEKPVGRALQYIGVRTLDIYLLHYIFLPKLPMVGEWFKTNHPNFILDITASVIIGLLVIAFCILVSNILRISPLFRKHLFGRK